MRRAGAIFLAVFAISGCKDDVANKPQTSASAAPTNSAIPDDLVINSFFAGGKSVEVAVDGAAPAFGELGGGGAGDTGDAKLKVLDPGSDPKTKLAYNMPINKTQTVVATVNDEMTGPDVPPDQQKQPTLKYTLAMTAKKKLDAGKVQVELKVTKFEIPGMDASKTASIATALGKLTMTFTLQPNGETTDTDLAGAEALPRGSDTIVQMMARVQSTLFVPLPTAPIGPGARWKTTVMGQDAAQLESTYTLVAKTDGAWDMKLDNNTIAPPRTLSDPRSGQKLTINIKGASHYTFATAFDGPVSKLAGDSGNEIAMSDGGPKRVNNEKMSLVVEKAAK